MQRYFLSTPFTENGVTSITGADGQHIVRVMRMSIGDQIIAVSDGEAFLSEITEVLSDGVAIKKVDESPFPSNEMPVQVTIACGLPKGDKLELIAQKGTELGMTAMIPFIAERSIVKWDAKKGAKKTERLQKIAKEAAEQCHRTIIPTIENPVPFQLLLKAAKEYDVLLIADEEIAKNNDPNRIADRLKKVYHRQSVLVVFGPEGGLSRNEVEKLHSTGFQSIALGPRILRTETAPLYFLAAVSYEFE